MLAVCVCVQSKLDGINAITREKKRNLRRLEAQRNELNTQGT